MSKHCQIIHQWFNGLQILGFPFDENAIPSDGIYILFEKGELSHGVNRIVRVGTHTGNNQLRPRLMQHFVVENKDRSIFRKNIGRCVLSKSKDTFLERWELDLTSRDAKRKYSGLINGKTQEGVERIVTRHIQNNFTFTVFPIGSKRERLLLERKIISTVSACNECRPSKKWFGLYSPKEKIKHGRLWQVNELNKEPLNKQDLKELKEAIFAHKQTRGRT